MNRRATALALALGLVSAGSVRAAGPSEVFVTNCAVCHGEDGKGQTEEGKKKGARNLTSKEWQKLESDADITKVITKGKGKMPSFGKKLSADEIKALVADVRAFGQ